MASFTCEMEFVHSIQKAQMQQRKVKLYSNCSMEKIIPNVGLRWTTYFPL